MRHFIKKYLAVFLLYIFGITVTNLAHAETWIKVTSDHFVVYSNENEKSVQKYVESLEKYRYVLNATYGVTDINAQDSDPKLSVYFVASDSNLHQVRPNLPAYTAGFYTACSQGEFALAIDQNEHVREAKDITNQRENFSQVIMFHEYAHRFMSSNLVKRHPHWLAEGFADYYSATVVKDDQAIVGFALMDRFGWFSYGREIPYEDILSGRDNYWKNSDKLSAFYAQSWLLTHYLFSTPQRRTALTLYLQAYSKGEDPIQSFESHFGIKVKDISRILETYMFSKELQAQILRFKGMKTPVISSENLPQTMNKLLLLDAATICVNKSYRATLFEKIKKEVALYPDDNYAKMVMSRAQILIGDEAEAIPYLSTRESENSDDFEAHSWLGEAYSLMAHHKNFPASEDEHSLLKKARKHLGRAYQLDPLNARNLYYLSMAQQDLPDFPNENAIASAENAHYLAPSVDAYAFWAARLFIQKNRLSEAAEVLTAIANDPHGGNGSILASKIITAIKVGATQQQIQDLMQTKQISTDE